VSIKILTQVWEGAPFDGYTLIVLLALADSASDEGWCWPSVEMLRTKARVPERTLYQALKNLIGAGWVQKENRPVRDGWKRIIHYRVIPGGNLRAQHRPATCAPARHAEWTAHAAKVPATYAEPLQPHIGGTVNEPSVEPLALSAPSALAQVAFTVPLNDGSQFPVDAQQVERWRLLYPGIDVAQELRKYLGWAEANPRKRKTRRGILASINTWLSSAQDRAGRYATTDASQQRHRTAGNGDAVRRALQRLQSGPVAVN